MAAYDAAVPTKVAPIEGYVSTDRIAVEAGMYPAVATAAADDGPFIRYPLALVAAGAGGVDDVITAPGTSRALYIVDIQFGGVLTTPNFPFELVFGSTYQFSLGIFNGIAATGNDSNRPIPIYQKLPANVKFGVKNNHATVAFGNSLLTTRFAIVRA